MPNHRDKEQHRSEKGLRHHGVPKQAKQDGGQAPILVSPP